MKLIETQEQHCKREIQRQYISRDYRSGGHLRLFWDGEWAEEWPGHASRQVGGWSENVVGCVGGVNILLLLGGWSGCVEACVEVNMVGEGVRDQVEVNKKK